MPEYANPHEGSLYRIITATNDTWLEAKVCARTFLDCIMFSLPRRIVSLKFIGITTNNMFLKGYPLEAKTAQKTETRVCIFPGPY